MTGQEIIEATEACLLHSCQACPLFTKWNENCNYKLLEEIKALATARDIKASDPRITHEYGRGHVLHFTLHDEGKMEAEDLVKNYVGGYVTVRV